MTLYVNLLVAGLIVVGVCVSYWLMRREHCGDVGAGSKPPDLWDMLYAVGITLGVINLTVGALGLLFHYLR